MKESEREWESQTVRKIMSQEFQLSSYLRPQFTTLHEKEMLLKTDERHTQHFFLFSSSFNFLFFIASFLQFSPLFKSLFERSLHLLLSNPKDGKRTTPKKVENPKLVLVTNSFSPTFFTFLIVLGLRDLKERKKQKEDTERKDGEENKVNE